MDESKLRNKILKFKAMKFFVGPMAFVQIMFLIMIGLVRLGIFLKLTEGVVILGATFLSLWIGYSLFYLSIYLVKYAENKIYEYENYVQPENLVW